MKKNITMITSLIPYLSPDKKSFVRKTMHIIIFLLLISFIIQPAFSQTPSKKEIQDQMLSAMNELKAQIADVEKQLAEAKKNKEDAETIKDLEDQLKMLKKQVEMMGGLNKNLANISDKIVQQATEEDPVAPKKDVTRINSLPKKILTEAELSLFLKNVHAGVEKIIPAEEKKGALEIYNETKAKYKTSAIIGNAASGCWMLGHWEKALFIMGKVCMDDITNTDNLNNYAAFLIMTGGEQAALPILEYLNSKYPNNSTIQNNIGQAWFGLGDMEKAKKNLEDATSLYSNHSMANATLSKVSLAGPNPDKTKSISFLKASLKECYDPEKEAELRKLGYEIKFADMPPLNYPMKKDPFGLIPLIQSWDPNKIQSSIANGETAFALQRYINGVKDFKGELVDENVDFQKKLDERAKKLMDPAYNQEFLEPYNCPAYLLAAKSLQLYCIERQGQCFKKNPTSPSFLTGLLLPIPIPYEDMNEIMNIGQILYDCEKFWFDEVLTPLASLGGALKGYGGDKEISCEDYDLKMNAYLEKRKEIYANGVKLIQNEFIKKSDKLTTWIKYNLYAGMDDPPKDMDDLSFMLISKTEFTIRRRSFQNDVYEGVLRLIENANKFESRYQSSCQDKRVDPEQGSENVSHHKVEKLECEYVKRVLNPVDYVFEIQCHTIIEKTNPKLPKRKPDVPKGSAASSKPTQNRVVMPPLQISGRGGPNGFFNEEDQQLVSNQQGPLTPENKDISQFSLEYNKWGNLVGFNFQLNEDGSALKDPDSIESGIDSRWSWNAIATSKKGFLNGLFSSNENPKETKR